MNKAPTIIHENLFGGTGTVRVWNCSPMHNQKPFDVVLFCILDGFGSVGAHIQKSHQELVLCLSGEGVIHIGKEVFPFSFGQSYSIAENVRISIENKSAEPLLYTITKVALS